MNGRAAVIVTRPIEQAAVIARRIENWGYRVFLLPLMTIAPVPWAEHTRKNLQQLHRFDFVHFSSPNAIRYALEPLRNKLLCWSAKTHIGLMGSGSQDLMRDWYPESEAQWLSPTQEQHWDSESLIYALEQQRWLKEVRRALLVKGQGGRELLADWLRSQSIDVDYAEVYRRRCLELNPEVEARLQSLAGVGRYLWLLTSSEGALALGKAIQQLNSSELRQQLWHARVLVTHERVAWAAHQVGFESVIRCLPGEQALKAALESAND